MSALCTIAADPMPNSPAGSPHTCFNEVEAFLPRDAGTHRLALSLLCVGVLAAGRLRAPQHQCNGFFCQPSTRSPHCQQPASRLVAQPRAQMPTDPEVACHVASASPSQLTASAADLPQDPNSCPSKPPSGSPSESAKSKRSHVNAYLEHHEVELLGDRTSVYNPSIGAAATAGVAAAHCKHATNDCTGRKAFLQSDKQTTSDGGSGEMGSAGQLMVPLGLPLLPQLAARQSPVGVLPCHHRSSLPAHQSVPTQGPPDRFHMMIEASAFQEHQQLARSCTPARMTSAQHNMQKHKVISTPVSAVKMSTFYSSADCTSDSSSSFGSDDYGNRKGGDSSGSRSSLRSKSSFAGHQQPLSRCRVRFADCSTSDSSDTAVSLDRGGLSRDDRAAGRCHLDATGDLTMSTHVIGGRGTAAPLPQTRRLSIDTAADPSSSEIPHSHSVVSSSSPTRFEVVGAAKAAARRTLSALREGFDRAGVGRAHVDVAKRRYPGGETGSVLDAALVHLIGLRRTVHQAHSELLEFMKAKFETAERTARLAGAPVPLAAPHVQHLLAMVIRLRTTIDNDVAESKALCKAWSDGAAMLSRDRSRDGRRAAGERGPPIAEHQLLRNVLLSISTRLGGVTLCLTEAVEALDCIVSLMLCKGQTADSVATIDRPVQPPKEDSGLAIIHLDSSSCPFSPCTVVGDTDENLCSGSSVDSSEVEKERQCDTGGLLGPQTPPENPEPKLSPPAALIQACALIAHPPPRLPSSDACAGWEHSKIGKEAGSTAEEVTGASGHPSALLQATEQCLQVAEVPAGLPTAAQAATASAVAAISAVLPLAPSMCRHDIGSVKQSCFEVDDPPAYAVQNEIALRNLTTWPPPASDSSSEAVAAEAREAALAEAQAAVYHRPLSVAIMQRLISESQTLAPSAPLSSGL